MPLGLPAALPARLPTVSPAAAAAGGTLAGAPGFYFDGTAGRVKYRDPSEKRAAMESISR